MEKNPMYKAHAETYINSTLTGNKAEARRILVNKNETIRESNAYINAFYLDVKKNYVTSLGEELWGICKKLFIYFSYKKHFLYNTNVRKYYEAGIYTTQ